MTSSGDSNNLNGVVKYLLNQWGEKQEKRDAMSIHDGKSVLDYFKGLDRGLQFRILFLLIHGHKGTIGYGNGYASQKDVRELAGEFEVDYSHIDAEVRFELAPQKYKEVHRTYLDNVRSKSEDAKVPHLFSDKWRAKD
jgi:hypothetical protein